VTCAEILERLRLERESPIPLHHQLSEAIGRQIKDGSLQPGQRLPTVKMLARHCRVSVTTIQRSLDNLERERAIERRQGAGVFVSKVRARATDIVLCEDIGQASTGPGSFWSQMVQGLERGYADPDRRFMFTQFSSGAPTGQELLEICRVRRCDGLLAYRPNERIQDALRSLSRHVATVSLFNPVPHSAVDLVGADPLPPLRRMLLERIARGARHFASAGVLDTRELSRDEASPYRAILTAFRETMAEQGIEARIHWSRKEVWSEATPEILDAFKDLPEGAVLVLATPHIGLPLIEVRPDLDVICYTEFRRTVDAFGDRMAFLYMGIDALACAAVDLLKSRNDGTYDGPTRTVRLEPRIVEKVS